MENASKAVTNNVSNDYTMLNTNTSQLPRNQVLILLQNCAHQSLPLNVYSIMEQLWEAIQADGGSQHFTILVSMKNPKHCRFFVTQVLKELHCSA
jgi:hypothetical protein